MNVVIKITLKRRPPSGRERVVVVASQPRALTTPEMKRLWEAEQAINALVSGVQCRIDVEEE